MHDKLIDILDDTMDVIRIQTKASGPFTFSCKYDENLISKLLLEASLLHNVVRELPILPNILSDLNKEIIRKSIHSTAAIEGNPLTEEEVAETLDKKDAEQLSTKNEREILNLQIAYDMVRNEIDENTPVILTEDLVRKSHRLITKGLEDEIGGYRSDKVRVSDKGHGGTYLPPKIYDDVNIVMKKFVSIINDEEICNEHPIIRAILAHYYIGKIHPFNDGNGRTARLIEAILLKSQGFRFVPALMSNYYYQHMDDYYLAFNLTHKHKNKEVTPFLEFALKGMIDVLNNLKETIYGHIRRLAFQDYVRFRREEKQIAQRQFELLDILIYYPQPFTAHDLQHQPVFRNLYKNVSPRTVKRDIEKLIHENLLTTREDGSYELNRFVLD